MDALVVKRENLESQNFPYIHLFGVEGLHKPLHTKYAVDIEIKHNYISHINWRFNF